MPSRRKVLSLLPLGLLLATWPAAAQPARFLPGVHYRELAQPAAEADDSDLLEFFWYGCAHCYAFEPVLNDWRASRPGLKFLRSPAPWGDAMLAHARLYHAAAGLDRLEDLHPALFDAVQHERGRLLRRGDAEAFFAARGVDEALLGRTLASFTVQTALRRDEALYRKVQPPAVPSLLVKGRYLVTGTEALRTHADMLAVVDFLLAQP